MSAHATPEREEFRAALLREGLLLDSGVPGIYGHGAAFVDVRARLEALIGRAAAERGAEQLRFPPVLPLGQLRVMGALEAFPHLIGTVYSFDREDEQAAGEGEWDDHQHMTEVSLVPAACYPVYPALAARGRLTETGVFVDAGGGWVFRHEPSRDPLRAQAFRQHELVRVGRPDDVASWREEWMELAVAMLQRLGLEPEISLATDPFFGRRGLLMARLQRERGRKYELQARVAGPEPVALASFNLHDDHFSSVFGIELEDGEPAATACVGFGHERIALALLDRHGLRTDEWPADARRVLWS